MRFFLFTLLILTSTVQANGEALKNLDDQYKYYDSEYEGFLRSKYELNVSEYYWKKVKDVQALGLALSARSSQILNRGQELNDEYKEIRFGPLQPMERLGLMRAKYYDLSHQRATLEQYNDSLSRVRDSAHLTCEEKIIEDIGSRMDPSLMYPIPQYAFDPTGVPKIDVNYYFSVNYSSSGGMSGTVGGQSQMSDGQQTFVYVGAGAVTLVAACFGVVEPTTVSLIFSGTVAVLTGVVAVYNDLNGNKEYIKTIKKMQQRYAELNSLIVKKHDAVSSNRQLILSKRCHEIVEDTNKSSILTNYISSLSNRLQSDLKHLRTMEMEMAGELHEEEERLLQRVVTSKEFFKRNLELISTRYAQQMERLFEYEMELDSAAFMYFISSPAVAYANYTKDDTLRGKMEKMNGLWDDLLVGEAKFDAEEGPKSINWEAMSSSLRGQFKKELP